MKHTKLRRKRIINKILNKTNCKLVSSTVIAKRHHPEKFRSIKTLHEVIPVTL